MIRIDQVWLCAAPVDMRAGAERLLACVVQTLGAAHAHHGYLFANVRATRIKLLVHDGFGVWCAARRLNAGRFVWVARGGADAERGAERGGERGGEPSGRAAAAPLQLTAAQFDALVLGLPWQRLHEMSVITRT